MTPEVHDADSIDRTEVFAGLSFDWPSVARTATKGLLVGLVLGVVALLTGDVVEPFGNPAHVLLLNGVIWCAGGAGFEFTGHWRGEGGVRFWLAWAVCGGLAGATLLGTMAVLLPVQAEFTISDLPGFLIFWLLAGPFAGTLVGVLFWAWRVGRESRSQ